MLTLFTWGYYGWGNHTPDLVKSVDAVERIRGFQPPSFVDIRIRRQVRAAGFTGPAFEKLLGPARHRWMKSLGNSAVETRTGPNIQIAEPAAADELLDLAVESARHEQRLLFFCSCQWPRCDGEIACHRMTVAGLVLDAATKRGIDVELVEWPGGDPQEIELEVSRKDYHAIRNGRKTVPLSTSLDLARMAGLPWCSIATIRHGDDRLQRIVGPAICQTTGWALPVFECDFDPGAERGDYLQRAIMLRKEWGLGAALSR